MDEPAKLAQKDTEARWTRKHGKIYYGYKNHIAIDVNHKLIRAYTVTPASTHDSQELQALLEAPSTRKALWADGAYQSEAHAKLLQARGIENHCMSVPGGSRP